MKNILIATLMTYIFWADICVIHPLPVLPLMFVAIWLMIAGIDDLIDDYRKTIRRGQRLQRRIRKMEREVH